MVEKQGNPNKPLFNFKKNMAVVVSKQWFPQLQSFEIQELQKNPKKKITQTESPIFWVNIFNCQAANEALLER